MLFYTALYVAAISLVCVAEHSGKGVASGPVLKKSSPLSRCLRFCLWFLAFLVIFFVSALRFDVGTDYSSAEGYLGYVELFRLYADGGAMRYGIDPSYLALIRIINAFGGNAQWLFVISSAVICGLVVRACRRVSCSPALSFALFLVAGLYLESFNIVRQWMAIACVLNGFAWVGWSAEDGVEHPSPRGRTGVSSRSFWRYAMWIALGAVAHSSALFWLFLWPLFSLRLNVRRCLLLLVLLVALAFVGWNVLAVVLAGTRYGRYFYDPSGLYTTPHLRPNAIVTTACTLGLSMWAYRRRWAVTEKDAACAAVSSEGEQSAAAAAGGHTAERGAEGPEKGAVAAVSPGTLTPSNPRLWGLRDPLWGRWASALMACQVALLALLVAEAFLPYIVDRVARYLAPLLMLQIPWALQAVNGRRLRLGLSLLVCACWFAASTLQFVGGKDDVLPYRSILTTPREEVSRMFDTPPVVPELDRPLTGGAGGEASP